MAGVNRCAGNIVCGMGRAGVAAEILESLEHGRAVIGFCGTHFLRRSGKVLVDAVWCAVQTIGAIGASGRITEQFPKCVLVGGVHLPHMEADIAAVYGCTAARGEHHQSEIDVRAEFGGDSTQCVQLGLPLLDAAWPVLIGGIPVGAVVDDDQHVGIVRHAIVGRVDVGVLSQADRRRGKHTQ